jgi:hypothetical protein
MAENAGKLSLSVSARSGMLPFVAKAGKAPRRYFDREKAASGTRRVA